MALPPAGSRRIEPITGLDELGLPADLVTGEAVVLDLRPASFATRALALVLDLIIQAAVLFAAILLLALTARGMDAAATAAVILAIVVSVLVGLPVAVETLTRGRSVGKLAAGLRVVRDDGGPIRFRQALVRGLLAVFEIYLTTGGVALIVSLASARGRRLGDVLAGTYVIRERAGSGPSAPVVMPPQLAGWAHGVDLGRMPDGLALAIRQFLRRADTLHPASRLRLGLELAARVTPFVAPGPPAGVHPELFLAAVLAERRDRDLVRLRAEQDARQARERRREGAPVLSAGGTALIGEPTGGRRVR
ncbi:MAG TPA: RDD family protein [Kineosporiaceae bacterium]|nr:RDD family protein [Kineosporiaceae bacterium]